MPWRPFALSHLRNLDLFDYHLVRQFSSHTSLDLVVIASRVPLTRGTSFDSSPILQIELTSTWMKDESKELDIVQHDISGDVSLFCFILVNPRAPDETKI